MDQHLISLLEELSLRSYSEDEKFSKASSTGYPSSTCTSSSNVSSPSEQQLINNPADDDSELQTAVNSLFRDLKPDNINSSPPTSQHSVNRSSGYDKSKLLVALLGNIDLVTCAVKKINRVVSLGKRMEQIYRAYYVDSNASLDMNEIHRLIGEFSSIYNNESYVREVNVSRMYHAYCKKLIDIYEAYNSKHQQSGTAQVEDCLNDQEMIS